MSVTIKYKGNTIASANTDTTKTLKTSGKYCEGDIVVENVQDGGITPSGSIAITENGTYDVTEYASADVNVSGGAEITEGIVVKARDANGYATEVDFYGTVVQPYQFGCGRSDTPFWAQYLESVNLMDDAIELGTGAFSACGRSAENHTDFILPESCTKTGNGAFSNCGFNSVTAFFTDLTKNQQIFSGANLKNVYLPKCTRFQSNSSFGNFRGASGLENVVLGSVGYGVTQIGYPFRECTQTGLTITAYCNGAYADTCLAGIRNGATNATIIIKDSTTGEVIVTSTP